jgi:hypothetical protein
VLTSDAGLDAVRAGIRGLGIEERVGRRRCVEPAFHAVPKLPLLKAIERVNAHDDEDADHDQAKLQIAHGQGSCFRLLVFR